MSLWELWREWASGNSTLEFELWGVEMVWWGRIGKILQLLGALTVLVEVVGTERMLRTGEALQQATPFRGMVDRVSRRWQPVWVWVRERAGRATAASRSTAAGGAAQVRGASLAHVWWRLGIALLFVVVALLFASWAWLLVLAAVAGGLALIGLAALLSALGWVVAVGFIRPAAWLISRPALDAWVKVVAIALVVAGVHFDLLAS